MSDPSPSPSHDDGVHSVLFATGEKMLIEDGLGPARTSVSFEVLGVDGWAVYLGIFWYPPNSLEAIHYGGKYAALVHA